MQPLEGILVLDMCRRYPGAYTAMILADFGAEVIKVDPPEGFTLIPKYQGGEPLTIDLDPASDKFAAYFILDRNKKSIIINLKNQRGVDAFLRLAKQADVLIEGFRPGTMKRLGLDYETLKKVNPGLIFCSESGYGADGPYAARPVHDQNVIGVAGALSLIGEKNGPPYLPSNFLADAAGAGLHGVIGVLLALRARERTGKGQFVDISFLDTVISLMAWDTSYYFLSEKVPRRGETWNTGATPFCNVYRCKDGEYITLACFEPVFWENLCRALEREDLIPYMDPPPKDAEQTISELAKVFATKTRQEWVEFFQDKDIAFAPVNYLNETFSDPQVLHRHMLVEVEHPKLGKVKQTGIAIKLSETPGRIQNLGVAPGTNTDEILNHVGFKEHEIADLRRQGAVA